MTTLKNVDTLFRTAVDEQRMPGIVAMAATDRGLLYEGAFGRRSANGMAVILIGRSTRDLRFIWFGEVCRRLHFSCSS